MRGPLVCGGMCVCVRVRTCVYGGCIGTCPLWNLRRVFMCTEDDCI